MFDAVSNIVMPKLHTDVRTKHTEEITGPVQPGSPEDISSLSVAPLEHFRRQVHLISFAFESDRFRFELMAVGSWSRPHRRHSKIANLESAFARHKYI
jgi:hypothetical protein